MEKKEALQLDDTVKENSRGQVILGRLEGPCADFLSPTRNNRMYSEELWEKVFSNDIVNEYFESGGIPGELDHPTDRLETCSEKIAIMMPEKPKKDKNGKLIASFDILDTPNGRIAYTLAKYGYKLGISSRGGGDVTEDFDGKESVNPDTYDFQGFDLVLLPAVKDARLKMVESLQRDNGFSNAICEALDKSNKDEQRVMKETLNNLNIKYTNVKKQDLKEKVNLQKNSAADDVRAKMIKDLQESLLRERELERKVTLLQERLSVCNAKEVTMNEEIAKYKRAVTNLTESSKSAKALKVRARTLTKELNQSQALLKEAVTKNRVLEKKTDSKLNNSKLLQEKLERVGEDLEVSKTKRSILEEQLTQHKEENKVLTEQLADAKKDLAIKVNQYSTKLDKTTKLVEQYKSTAQSVLNKYIELQSSRIGVKAEELKENLPKNYSLNDIDKVCESMGNYNLKMGSLPVQLQKGSKIKIQESLPKVEQVLEDPAFDDTVDEELLKLARL